VIGKLSAASPAAVAGRGRAGFGWAGVVAVAGLPGGLVGVGLVAVRRCRAARSAAAAFDKL